MKKLKLLFVLTGLFLSACDRKISSEDPNFDINEMRASRIASQKLGKNIDPCRYISEIKSSPPPKTVVLTIDDGPSRTFNPYLLDLLKKYNIKATFFVVGSRIQSHSQEISNLIEEGHLLAHHSYSHPSFHNISKTQQLTEIEKTDELISQFVDYKMARYPYGNSTCFANDEFHRLGYKILGWHVDSCDWAYSQTGSVSAKDAKICGVSKKNRNNYVGHVVDTVIRKNGGIILIHETQSRTLAQLESIIQKLLAEGFEFKNLDDPEMEKYFY